MSRQFIRAEYNGQPPPDGYSTWRLDADGNEWFQRQGPVIRGVTEDDWDDSGDDQEPAEVEARRPYKRQAKPTLFRKIFGIPGWFRGDSDE